jgi:hypothetical protein
MTERTYIVIEGSDAKTNQAKMLVDHLHTSRVKSLYVHEPSVLPNHDPASRLSQAAQAELLELTAYRLNLYHETIKPALDRGEIVVADGNWQSSIMRLGSAVVHATTHMQLPVEYRQPRFTAVLYDPDQPLEELNQMIPPDHKINGRLTQTSGYIPTSGDANAVRGRIVQKLEHLKII